MGLRRTAGYMTRTLAFGLLVAFEAAAAQPAAARAGLQQSDVAVAEKLCDAAIRGYTIDAPIDHLLPTHGVYAEGYGVVLITDVNLVALPPLFGFAGGITDSEKARIHDSKVKRLPAVRELFARVVADVAVKLERLSPEESVLLRVNFYNLVFEHQNDLPKRLTISGRKKDLLDAARQGSQPGALSGILKVTVE